MDVIDIPISKIWSWAWIQNRPWNNTYQFVKVYKLAKDIESVGLKEPITVIHSIMPQYSCMMTRPQMQSWRPIDCYIIDDGNHRFLAVCLLGWTSIPAYIVKDETKRND